MLEGKKTYIFAALVALATFAKTIGWIDDTTYQALLALFGAGGLAALRSGVTKSGPNG